MSRPPRSTEVKPMTCESMEVIYLTSTGENRSSACVRSFVWTLASHDGPRLFRNTCRCSFASPLSHAARIRLFQRRPCVAMNALSQVRMGALIVHVWSGSERRAGVQQRRQFSWRWPLRNTCDDVGVGIARNLSLPNAVTVGKTLLQRHLGEGSETLPAGGTLSERELKTPFNRPAFGGVGRLWFSMGLASGVPVENHNRNAPPRPVGPRTLNRAAFHSIPVRLRESVFNAARSIKAGRM